MPYDPLLERLKKLEKAGSKRKELTVLDRIIIAQALTRIEFGFDEDGSSKKLLNKCKKVYGVERWGEILAECNKRASSKEAMKGLFYEGLTELSL